MQVREETTTNKSIFQRLLKSKMVTKPLLKKWNAVWQSKSRMRSETGINLSSTLLKSSSIYPARIIVTRPHWYIHNVKCYGYIGEKFRETYDTCCTCTTVCKQAHPIMAVGTTVVVARAVRQRRLN